MATLIASSVVGGAGSCGRSYQKHLVYGTNNAQFYVMYLSGTQTLTFAYASAMNGSWTTTSTPFTLAQVHSNQSSNFGFDYNNVAGGDYLHMCASYQTASAYSAYHSRFLLNTTAIGYVLKTSETQISTKASTIYNGVSSGCSAFANPADDFIYDCSSYILSGSATGDQRFARWPNAQTADAWTIGSPTLSVAYAPTTVVTSDIFADLGGGAALNVCDNANTTGFFTNFRWSKNTSAAKDTWSTSANVDGTGFTSAGSYNWGMIGRTTTDIHLVCVANGTTSFAHRRFNGTAWSTGNTIPTITLHASSCIFLATDLTNVWAFVIDSSNNVKYCKWNGSAWDGSWTTLEAGGSNARTDLAGWPYVANGQIGVIYVEANGANFDLYGSALGMPQSTSLGVADVSSNGVALSVASSGSVSASLGVADCSSSLPSLTTAASGTVSKSLGVADSSSAAVSLTVGATGSASTALGVANVSSDVPAISIVQGGSGFALTTANCDADLPALTVAATGTATITLTTANCNATEPALTVAPSGTATVTPGVANVDGAEPVLGISGSGNISRSLGVANVNGSEPAISISAGSWVLPIGVANVSGTLPSLTVAATGNVSSVLPVADNQSVAISPTVAPSSGVSTSLGVANVSGQEPTLSISGSGNISKTLGVADATSTAVLLTTVPSGSVTRSVGVADVQSSEPALTVAPTGSAPLGVSVANVSGTAPSIILLTVGSIVPGVADASASLPSLTVSGSGNVDISLGVADVSASEPALTVSSSGTYQISLGTANVNGGVPSVSLGGTGTISTSLPTASVSGSVPALTVEAGLSGAQNIPLPVANVSGGGVPPGFLFSGTATISLGIANVSEIGGMSLFQPSSPFFISADMTVLIN